MKFAQLKTKIETMAASEAEEKDRISKSAQLDISFLEVKMSFLTRFVADLEYAREFASTNGRDPEAFELELLQEISGGLWDQSPVFVAVERPTKPKREKRVKAPNGGALPASIDDNQET